MTTLLLFMLGLVCSQLNVQPFAFQSILTNSTTITSFSYATIRNNNTQQYVSAVENGIVKIIKFNTTTSNVYRLGEYLLPANISQTTAYSYLNFFRGYILACLNNVPCRVFNDSSFQYIGSLNQTFPSFKGFFLESRSFFVFATRTNISMNSYGFGYFEIDTLPNINPVYVHIAAAGNSFVCVDKSDAENYVSVAFSSSFIIRIYRTSDFQNIANLTASSSFILKKIWSKD